MSAKLAVLGLVIEQPGYGYQLAQRLDERCGSWGWEPSGVYGALDLLARDGHVRSLREKGSGETGRAAPRAIYQATTSGRDFFRDWMLKPSPPSRVRQDLDLKLLFSGPQFLPWLIDQSWAQERQCLEELEALIERPSHSPGLPRNSWRDAAALLQRDAEIKLLQVRVEWLQDARRAMKEMLEGAQAQLAGHPSG